MKRTCGFILLLMLVASAAGCASYEPKVEPVRYPRDETSETGGSATQQPSASVVAPVGSGIVADIIGQMVDEARAKLGPGASVGCLPLVSYDLRHNGPWVSRLGEELADAASERFAQSGFQGRVLSTADMGVRVMEANLAKATLSTLESVARHGARLGVDAIMFGSIRRDNNVDTYARDVLTVDAQIYDLAGGIILSRRKFEIASDRGENKKLFQFAGVESLWQPDSKWEVPQEKSAFSFHDEIRVASELLMGRVMAALPASQTSGHVYLPPLDTSEFVRAVSRLRAAQIAYAGEMNRRMQDAAAANTPLDRSSPMTLGGVAVDNVQEADDYLATLTEGIMNSEAAQFGLSVSNMMAERLLARLAGSEVRVRDFGSTDQSDSQLVLGQLASGGLANSAGARKALEKQGIQYVVATRAEKFGNGIVLRAMLHDVQSGRILTSCHVPVADNFVEEMRKELAIEDYGRELTRIDNVEKDSSEPWVAIYDKIKNGIFRLEGQTAEGTSYGTGFLVSSTGLIMTNSHVAGVLGSTPHAVLQDGSTVPVQVVVDNPFWDIAIVRATGLSANLYVFTFAEQKKARVGCEVAVLGHPKNTSGWVLSPGHLSSLNEEVVTVPGQLRPSYLYTCPTRAGTSGSPVLLLDGTVVAVNSHGLTGQVLGSEERTELTGFAVGAPGTEALKILQGLGETR